MVVNMTKRMDYSRVRFAGKRAISIKDEEELSSNDRASRWLGKVEKPKKVARPARPLRNDTGDDVPW